jgi:hypothetical protein
MLWFASDAENRVSHGCLFTITTTWTMIRRVETYCQIITNFTFFPSVPLAEATRTGTEGFVELDQEIYPRLFLLQLGRGDFFKSPAMIRDVYR